MQRAPELTANEPCNVYGRSGDHQTLYQQVGTGPIHCKPKAFKHAWITRTSSNRRRRVTGFGHLASGVDLAGSNGAQGILSWWSRGGVFNALVSLVVTLFARRRSKLAQALERQQWGRQREAGARYVEQCNMMSAIGGLALLAPVVMPG